ncbi:ABC transporter permease subunit [Novosphingobium sp. BL-52-GroH]|uniref:ABC transporter permease subunit n=1 Tax=Novosphingobium sp. BL-52-GroH TaxID=3349877 RepID=UPI00384D8CF6
MTKISRLRTFMLVFRHEWKLLLADRSLPLVCGLLAAMICYGFYNGFVEIGARDEMVAKALSHDVETAKGNHDSFRRMAAGSFTPGPFDNLANPATLGGAAGPHAVLPSTALAPVAIGQSDMMPNYYRIGMKSKVDFMYDSEIENPWALLSGHFDLAFVMIWVLPLLIFALSYNLLSAERETGTQRILLSLPLGVATLALGKIAVRALLILSVATVLPMLLTLIFRPEARSLGQAVPLLLWCALVIAYGLFWFALAFLVNSLRWSSAANALILIASWTVLVLIVPVLLNLTIGMAHPAPSRTALANTTRAIKADNLKRYDDLFSGDYRYIAEPESLKVRNGRIDIPPRTLASFLAKRDMDARVERLLTQFDRTIAEQQEAVNHIGFLSPAILLYDGMTSLAGTDGGRYGAFRAQVGAFHDGWRRRFEPSVMSGTAMTEADLGTLPVWRWQEVARGQMVGQTGWRLVLILLVTALFALAGSFALRRYRVQ